MAHADMDGAVDRGGGRGEVRGQMIAVGGFRSRRRILGLMVLETAVLLLSSSSLSAVVIIHRLTFFTVSSRPERRDFGGGFSEAFC